MPSLRLKKPCAAAPVHPHFAYASSETWCVPDTRRGRARTHAPAILFFDEIDSMLGHRLESAAREPHDGHVWVQQRDFESALAHWTPADASRAIGFRPRHWTAS
ncbi:MAG: hypothetical protein AB7I50_23930 [Vicinamibacterales bacterium]